MRAERQKGAGVAVPAFPAPVERLTLVHRQRWPGLDLVTVRRPRLRELHLTLRPLANESILGMARRLASVLRSQDALVVRHEVFGPLPARAAELGWDWPVTWVEGGACAGGCCAGMHVFAVADVPVGDVTVDGRVVGRVFEDGYARHCVMGDVWAPATAGKQEAQARGTFERLESAVQQAGFEFGDVVRTWLFPDDILGWYGVLNRVRREFFAGRRVFEGLVPASTGVGGRNGAGAALMTGGWAAAAVTTDFATIEVLSPMQCPAPEYGSCFSRAVEMVAPDVRRLLVSGTASIEPKGASVCAGDIEGQIDLAMQVVRAILVSRGMDYADVTRATAYLRQPGHAPIWQRWVRALGLETMPLVTAQGVICREELLFEIELDAMMAGGWSAEEGEHGRAS